MLKHVPILSAALLLFGCDSGGYSGDIDAAPTVHTLHNGIALHRADSDDIFYLDGAVDKPNLKRLFTPESGEQVAWVDTGPDPEKPGALFVLTEPSDPRGTDRDERLYRITADGKRTAYNVGSRYDLIVFGPSQRYAILYHGEKSPSEGLYNPNEIALIDLTEKPGKENPRIFSVAMDGRRIDMVSFVPSIRIGGAERSLAVFMAGSMVRIVDLRDPERIWAKVPLLPAADPRTVSPKKLIAVDEEEGCAATTCEAKLFIQTTNTQDIYYITLGRSDEAFVDPQTKQLEAGGVPLDMAVVTDGDIQLLAALSRSGATQTKVNFVDIDTSAAFSIAIDDALDRLTHIETEEGGKLVLHAAAGNQAVYFLSLADIVKEKGRNLERFTVQGRVGTRVMLDDERMLLVPLNGRDLVILDLVTETADMISAAGEYDWQNAQIHEDVFFLLPTPGVRVDSFDLGSGSPDTLLLDDSAVSLHILPGRKSGAVVHSTPSGRVTLFPLGDPSRGNAKVVDGLWLKDILDAEVE